MAESPIERATRTTAVLGLSQIFKDFCNFYTELPNSWSVLPPMPEALRDTVVFRKNSNRPSVFDFPMAESPLEQATRTYEGGPPRAVESTLDLTSSNRTQTRGGYITRRRQRFETMLYFSTRGRRTSTRLATYEGGPPWAVEYTLDLTSSE